MSNNMDLKKLEELFINILEIDDASQVSSLAYRSIPTWDSVGHMALVAEIEDVFDIELSTQQVLDLSSFEKAVEIISELVG